MPQHVSGQPNISGRLSGAMSAAAIAATSKAAIRPTLDRWFRRIALYPARPVGGVLFLPDRHRLLEPVDAPLACRDCLVAVRCRDANNDRRLADFEVARAVRHRHAGAGPSLLDLLADLSHLRNGH